jgi:tetratricopeptide (TPR) repeat protein
MTPNVRRRFLPAPRSILLIAIGVGSGITAELGSTQQSIDSDAATLSSPTYTDRGDDVQAALDLGALQIDLNEFETAETAYLRGIELLIEEEGELSPQLIDPYRQLANIYLQLGQHVEALTVLEHAQHINQRNYGLFNTEQTLIIDEMSQAYQAAGDTRSAQELQEESLNIARRRFGKESLEVVPFHYRLAEYYELSRMRAKAREHYQDVIDILENHLDKHASEQLKPLRELVRIDILSGENTSARRRLEETLELGSSNSAYERALSLAVLGDYALATGRAETSIARYREAYATLAAEDAAAATVLFAKPALIDFIPPASPVDRTPGISIYSWGTITAEFEISAGGLARGVEIVAATPPGLVDARYRRRLMESYFRPRLVAGEPVATSLVRFSHRFRYVPPE